MDHRDRLAEDEEEVENLNVRKTETKKLESSASDCTRFGRGKKREVRHSSDEQKNEKFDIIQIPPIISVAVDYFCDTSIISRPSID
jgi:hypothetical protein